MDNLLQQTIFWASITAAMMLGAPSFNRVTRLFFAAIFVAIAIMQTTFWPAITAAMMLGAPSLSRVTRLVFAAIFVAIGTTCGAVFLYGKFVG